MKITPGRVDNQAGPWCCRGGGKGCQCCHTECHSVCPYITDPVGKASPESCSGWCQRHLLEFCCSTLSAQGPGWFDHLRMHRDGQWAVLVLNASCSSARPLAGFWEGLCALGMALGVTPYACQERCPHLTFFCLGFYLLALSVQLDLYISLSQEPT